MNEPIPQPQVIEIDGPPHAYFEVMEAGQQHVTRLRYRTLAIIGETEQSVRDWLDAALAEIRTWCDDEGAFIIWRRRPHIEETDGIQLVWPTEAEIIAGADLTPREVQGPKRWIARCRLITSVPMPESLWAKFEVKEGEPAPRV